MPSGSGRTISINADGHSAGTCTQCDNPGAASGDGGKEEKLSRQAKGQKHKVKGI